MNNIINKVIILLSLVLIAFTKMDGISAIIPITVSIAISCFLEYFNKKYLNVIVFCVYCVLCFFYPQFTYFMPLIAYDMMMQENQYVVMLGIIVLVKNVDFCGYSTIIIMPTIIIIGCVLKANASKAERLRREFVSQRDSLKEKSMNLETKLSELRYRQDQEISMATLNERNRIAREIHDNVGHLLSSSIIQIGAIMTTTTDENAKKNLAMVNETLNDGMDSIRRSVHDLRDDSIDLYQQLKKISDDFDFCYIEMDYQVSSNINIQLKYAIINIVKEALNNVMKHSNATKVELKLYEHPKILQLIIYDNGTLKKNINTEGMGIESIKQRVESLKGVVNIQNQNGFRIFASFNL
ncbi:Signal transduction histidine kinase [Hathewaya proteolytica DSM 3090]|uniref:histidine kinase n=1 Tax=Hathewaya proteolytica DSM 3090 TaxID=1121331 RepID=A0A1M6SL41_9CLOT|nr:histidine kinase [Hathewaya proteolytica]SHK45413.1 Signal transduction histidine kinase [Hathewaya proteolytica DSM 3090]